MVLVHMDEKWFYTIIVRKNNKKVPILCVLPMQYAIHHKSHISKCMCVCLSAFLPLDNDIGKGGEAIKLSLLRYGKMSEAK